MKQERAREIMCATGWLSHHPPDFQKCLLDAAQLKQHLPGEVLYEIGGPPDALCGLVQGEIAVYMAPEGPEPVLVHVAFSPWWAGDTALITDSPRRITLATRAESWVMHVERAAIERMAETDPQVWRRIGQITASHVDHALRVIASLTVADTRVRLAMALRRLVSLDKRKLVGPATVWISQQELGVMTRLSRNAVAQALEEMEGTGLIHRRYRRIEIPDIGALARLG